MTHLIPDHDGLLQLLNLILALISIYAISIVILGSKIKKPDQNHHPLFGQFTKNIPNIMCYLRFPLGGWIFCVYYFPALHTPFFAFTFHLAFAFVCIFDSLDGKFARKWNAITEDGKSLDPAADKWATFCLAVTAFMFGELRWWVLFVVFSREIISMLQRMVLRRRGEDASARWLGKLKTGVQFTVLYIVLIRSEVLPDAVFYEKIAKLFPDGLLLWGMILLCFATIISVFPYFKSFSYVNDYTKSPFKESSRAWYIVMIPNLFTVGNYLCGVTAVFFAMPEVEVAYRPFVCLFWILAAGLCDAFDGPLARTLNSHSDFGACLDSSTDLSTFGLATAIIIFLRFTEVQDTVSYLGIGIALVYFVYVHLRLARFTVSLNEKEDKGKKHDFEGMPSPIGAITVLIVFTFFDNIIVLSALIILISLLMYSKLDFISHSNSIHHPIYRYFLIPSTFVGFFMLLALIFQQPFVTAHFARELLVYFRICSWLLTVSVFLYGFDAIKRTYVRS
jgi:phosphatidylglycerophosphate synthase